MWAPCRDFIATDMHPNEPVDDRGTQPAQEVQRDERARLSACRLRTGSAGTELGSRGTGDGLRWLKEPVSKASVACDAQGIGCLR